MTDIDLPLASVEALVLPVSLSLPTPPVPTPPGVATDYNVYACTQNGAHDARTLLATAKVTRVTWVLNAPTIAEFTVDFDDPEIAQLPLSIVPFVADDDHNHEVQIYRNGQLLFWGPVVARQGDNEGRVFSYIAKDPLWYLTARFFGEANRHNFLTNGDFEDDSVGSSPPYVGWNTSGGSGSIEITDENFLTGQQAVHLQGSSFDLFLGQILPVTAGPIGLAVIVTAWVFVNVTSTTFINSSHIALKRVQPLTATVLQESDITLGRTIAARQWVRVSTALLLPPSSTSLVEVDLVAAGDDIYVDSVTLTIEESLSLIPANSGDGLPWDQVDIAKMIARYAGGAYPIGSPYTKSNIRLGTAGDPSGVRKVRTYQFFDHQAVYQGGVGAGGLDEFVQASDGFDMRVAISPTNRTLHFYYPAVGQTWDADLFRYVRQVIDGEISGESVRLLKYSWPETIEGAANNVTVIGGWGNGAGREEGGANLDTFGELTLEHIEAAPTGATIDLLGGIAEARAEQLGQAQVTPVLTLAEQRDPITGEVDVVLIGALLPGDLLPVVINDGPVQVDQTVRATQVVLTTDTETLAVSVQLNVPDSGHAPAIPQRSRSYLERRYHQRIYELERRILHVQGLAGGEGD